MERSISFMCWKTQKYGWDLSGVTIKIPLCFLVEIDKLANAFLKKRVEGLLLISEFVKLQ